MKLNLQNRQFYGMNLTGERKKKFFEFLSFQTSNQLRFEEVNVCLCGCQKRDKIANGDRFGFPVASYLCADCGLIYISPRLTADSLPLFYDKLYWGLVVGQTEDTSDDIITTGGEGYGADVAKFVDTYFKDRKSLKIAEVGMGNGQKLASLNDHFKSQNKKIEMFGCDFSKDAVAMGKAKGIKAFEGDLNTLAPHGPFDLVIMSHVVEHLNNPVEILKQVTSLLGETGYLYIEVPGVAELDQKIEYNYDFYLYSVIAHMYCFNLSSLTAAVESAGFQLIKGNEFVRSIFRPHKENLGIYKVDRKNVENVIQALNRAEDARELRLDNPKNKIKNIFKKVTGYEISRS